MGSLKQEQSDERLITATLAGDDEAFAFLVARYKRRIFALASRFAYDRDELDDICQEVFIKVYENLKKFRHDALFEHWIMRIAVHACHDSLRSRRHASKHSRLDDNFTELRDNAGEARYEAHQVRNFLRWAMARLKPDEQLVITLMELEELSVRETAELTGWSESNVKVRAHRARQALKRILEAHNER